MPRGHRVSRLRYEPCRPYQQHRSRKRVGLGQAGQHREPGIQFKRLQAHISTPQEVRQEDAQEPENARNESARQGTRRRVGSGVVGTTGASMTRTDALRCELTASTTRRSSRIFPTLRY